MDLFKSNKKHAKALRPLDTLSKFFTIIYKKYDVYNFLFAFLRMNIITGFD